MTELDETKDEQKDAYIDNIINNMVSAKDFEEKDLSRLIVTISQKMVGGDIDIQMGETVTYADLLFGILCTLHAVAEDNDKLGGLSKVLDDLISMSQNEEFHK